MRACIVLLIALSVPQVAAAQAADRFSAALTGFAVALGGSYGDEGPQLTVALDAMGRALDDWDAELRQLEGVVSAAAGRTDAASLHVQLATAYARRGRVNDAIRHLTESARLDPGRAETWMMLGRNHLLEGKAGDAASAFERAADADPANPVAAYWLLRSDAARPAERTSRALHRLDAAYQSALIQPAAPKRRPFVVSPALVTDSEDGLVLLPAAYAEGQMLLARGDSRAALAEFRRAFATDALNADAAAGIAPMLAGSAALRKGDVTAARAQFQQAAQLKPTSTEARRLLALTWLINGDLAKSAEGLRAVIGMRSDDERSAVMLARVLIQMQDTQAAETTLRQAIERQPQAALARLALGMLLVDLHRENDAADAYRAIAETRPVVGEARLLDVVGRLHQGADNADAAADAFARSIGRDPNRAETHVLLGRTHQAQDHRDQAFAEYVAALLIDPAEPNAFLGIGQLYLAEGRNDDAIGALRRFLSLQPGYVDARYSLATALLRAGRTEEGTRELAEFQRAQAQASERRRRMLEIGALKEEALLRASDGGLERAAALWRQIIEQEPGVAANHVALGEVLVKREEITAAVAQFERAASLGAAPDVFRQLSALYGRLGRVQDSVAAREKYERAVLSPASGGRP